MKGNGSGLVQLVDKKFIKGTEDICRSLYRSSPHIGCDVRRRTPGRVSGTLPLHCIAAQLVPVQDNNSSRKSIHVVKKCAEPVAASGDICGCM
jgi:hypothetical protein